MCVRKNIALRRDAIISIDALTLCIVTSKLANIKYFIITKSEMLFVNFSFINAKADAWHWTGMNAIMSILVKHLINK